MRHYCAPDVTQMFVIYLLISLLQMHIYSSLAGVIGERSHELGRQHSACFMQCFTLYTRAATHKLTVSITS